MIALIDGDVIVYSVGFASQEQTMAQNCMNAELLMEDILKATEADSYRVFLSDSLENNFRYKIDPTYKANRKDTPKPLHYDAIRQFLVNEFKAEFTPGQEADDALGIEQTAMNVWEHTLDGSERVGESVICSIDKDLLQIPGFHFDTRKKIHTTVTYDEGIKHFYKQLLVGDRVDNIFGIYGVGPVKAGRALDHLTNEAELFETVRSMYSDDERLLRNGQMLWIRRYRDEIWKFPGNHRSENRENAERILSGGNEPIEAEISEIVAGPSN